MSKTDYVDLQTDLANADAVEELFQTILGRPIDNEQFKRQHDGSHSIQYWVKRLIESGEFRNRQLRKLNFEHPSESFIDDTVFRSPSLTKRDAPEKVLVIGSCLTDTWKGIIEEANHNTIIDWQNLNGSEPEDLPLETLGSYAFQVIQLPLRLLLPESEYFTLPLSESGEAEAQALFDLSVQRLRRSLSAALKYNREAGLMTFVVNFAATQQTPNGFLLPKYSLLNFGHYIREINREIWNLVSQEKNVHVVDFDEICASLGKRYIVDEPTHHFNHGSLINSSFSRYDIDLTPHGSVRDLFQPRSKAAILATFNECVASYGILSPIAKIKLVIFDLDGTLWRGVAAEHDDVDNHLIEGWPLGMLEAAAFLKKRGILVAIASKNDPEAVKRIWQKLYQKRFPLENFVATKISWGPKTEAIGEILAETNLLAGNCLFVDDNPVEREQAKLAFPDLHVLDGPILSWRRKLLYSVETQVPYVTDESASRTQSIQGMIQREQQRKTVSEDDYIASLGVTVSLSRITDANHSRFPRALELLNKTNQFNTTGRRWTEQAMQAFFNRGGVMLVADVRDRLSDYGLTAIMLIDDRAIVQMVMSCRVFALRVEFALLDQFLRATTGQTRSLHFLRTEKNAPARAFLGKLGFDTTAIAAQDQEHAFGLAPDLALDPTLVAGVTIEATSAG